MRVLRVLLGASLLAGCSLDSSGSAETEDFLDDSAPVMADTGEPLPDVTLEDTFTPPEDSGAPDTFADDTFVADTFVADTFVADTFVADTFVADTFVADTFRPDTYVADTYVADTYVADTYRPDTFVSDMGVDAGPAPCGETNGRLYMGHCYFVVNTFTSWTTARDACVAASTTGHPAHLAVITTAGEWSHVNGLPGAAGYARWVGLSATAPSTSKSSYQWITGEAATYDKWEPGYPNGTGSCVLMHSSTFASPGTWEDRSCSSTSIPYICERE